MLKKLLAIIYVICGAVAFSQMQSNPDKDTLWSIGSCQDGDWNGGGRFYVKKRAEGGFTIGDDNPSNKVGHSKFWRVPMDAEYPWLCFEVEAFRPFNGYRCWLLGLQESGACFGSAASG